MINWLLKNKSLKLSSRHKTNKIIIIKVKFIKITKIITVIIRLQMIMIINIIKITKQIKKKLNHKEFKK